MAAESARMVEAADALGDRFVAMQGLAALGYSAIMQARFAQGEPAIRRAAAIAREDEKAYRLTVVLSLLAAQLGLQGRTGESGPLFEQARSLNPAFRDAIVVELEAFVHWMAGDFTAAVAAARETVAWVPGGASRRRALGIACGAMAAIETGDAREAERLLARVRQALGGRDWSYFFQYTRYGEAVLDWQLGRAAECVAVLADVADRLVKMEARAMSVFVLIDLAESAVDARDTQAAGAAASLLDDVARIADLPPHHGLAAVAAAWASLAGHDPVGAAARASEAIGLLSGAGWRSHLGRAHDLLGRSLAAAGRPGAVDALEEAVAIFAGCGAVWRRDRAHPNG